MISDGIANLFHLLPTVVWSLDKESQGLAETWVNRLDEGAKKFVKYASTWEHVRDRVKEFTFENFRRDIRQLGIRFEGNSRASVVLIAYGMGNKAYKDWKRSEEKLANIEKDIAGLRSQRILLARVDVHKLKDRDIRCSGIRDVPWLLTDKTSLGTTLDNAQFTALVHSLLDVLVLAERTGPRSPAQDLLNVFFDSPPFNSTVRLIASPESQLKEMIDELSSRIARAVLRRFTSDPPDYRSSSEKTKIRSSIHESLALLLKSAISSSDFQRWIKEEIGRWTLAHLLSEGPNLLRHLADTIERELIEAPSKNAPLTCFEKLAKAFAERLGFRRKPTSAIPPDFRHELSILASHLNDIKRLLDEIKKQNWIDPADRPNLPEDKTEEWGQFLERRLKEALDLPRQDAHKLIRTLASHIKLDLEKYFKQILSSDWGVGRDLVQKFSVLLKEGKLFAFSARLKAAKSPRANVILSSICWPQDKLLIEEKEVPWTPVGLWPTVPRPVLLAASEPVRLEDVAA